jgi:hypothetical protein
VIVDTHSVLTSAHSLCLPENGSPPVVAMGEVLPRVGSASEQLQGPVVRPS